MELKRKAAYFMIDSFLALALAVIAIGVLTTLPATTTDISQQMLVTQDVINILSLVPVKNIDSPWIQDQINTGIIQKPNLSVLEQIGDFWSRNETELARNLSEIVLGQMMSSTSSYGLWINGENIFANNKSTRSQNTVASRRIASGFQKGKPVYGYTAKAFLTGISKRRASAYVYFGGFVGEGNLTTLLTLPENITSLLGGILEVDAGTDFRLYVNDKAIGEYPRESGQGSYGIPDRWELNSSQVAEFTSGNNTVEIKFEYLNENATSQGGAYVAGGYLRVDYETSSTEDPTTYYHDDNMTATTRYYIPGIEGFINFYDALYVPGNLTELSLKIHYDHPYTMYVRLANVTIFQENWTGEKETIITNTSIADNLSEEGFTFRDVSQKNVPLRIGFRNVSTTVAPLDTFLVTDLSLSMENELGSTSQGTERDCEDPELDDSTTARLSAAKCAAKDFISAVLFNEGPQLGLIGYESATKDVFPLSEDDSALQAHIEEYDVGLFTCICCGVNTAIEYLKNNSNVFLISRKTSGWKYLDTDPNLPADWYTTAYDDSSWKDGTASFANGLYASVGTYVSRYAGGYYYRRTFNINDTTAVTDVKLYIASDDYASHIYLNGILVDSESSSHSGSYWNHIVTLDAEDLNNGTNVLAIRVYNSDGWLWASSTFFDAELVASTQDITTPRRKAMIVMSDGEANIKCNEQGTNDAEDDAIQAACDAYANHDILVYTVAFGPEAGHETMQDMAACGGGKYFNSSDASSLSEIYSTIADELITYTATQKANLSGVEHAKLFADSYFEMTYIPEVSKPDFGTIPVSVEGERFQNNVSESELQYPSTVTLGKVKALSYSADTWTDLVRVSNSERDVTPYTLSLYDSQYRHMGDPFVVHIPPSLFEPGEANTVLVRTGITAENATGGSPANRLVYELHISSILSFGSSFFTSEGCSWNITYYDGENATVLFPSGYNGTRSCSYENKIYNVDNALDDAAYRLFQSLDFDNDGVLTVKFTENFLEIETLTTAEVPTLWGPATMEVRTW